MRNVVIGANGLEGILTVPHDAMGLVIFAHGSGSSRFSPRNNFVAKTLQSRGFATLLFDLLTEVEASDRRNVFDIPLLGNRVEEAIAWAGKQRDVAILPIGLFGASTGAAAALVAAAGAPGEISAIVSRGGRPDLADNALPYVKAPTLMIVGGDDLQVMELNRQALDKMQSKTRLEIVPGATHLFEEPGALEQVVDLASGWFKIYCGVGKINAG